MKALGNRLLRLWPVVLISACAGATSGAKSADSPPSPKGEQSNADDELESLAGCRAVAACQADCAGGAAKSCEWLGHMHETGDGAPQDYAKAAEYYDQACTAGREESCAHLAMMYDIGLAVHEDPVRAVELYDKACKAGNSWACNREQELK
ncbi:MAG: hypothetical protein RJA70_4245 [Pseudomonadota bacterium]